MRVRLSFHGKTLSTQTGGNRHRAVSSDSCLRQVTGILKNNHAQNFYLDLFSRGATGDSLDSLHGSGL